MNMAKETFSSVSSKTGGNTWTSFSLGNENGSKKYQPVTGKNLDGVDRKRIDEHLMNQALRDEIKEIWDE